MSIKELTKQLIELRTLARRHEAEAKIVNEQGYTVEMRLFSAMGEEGLSSCRYEDLGVQIVATQKKFPRIKPEYKNEEDRIFAFLRDNKQGGVIREQVNAQTMKAVLRELAEAGVEMPDFVEVYSQNGVTIKKS